MDAVPEETTDHRKMENLGFQIKLLEREKPLNGT